MKEFIKKMAAYRRPGVWFAVLIVLLSVLYRNHDIAFMGPKTMHLWRQSDCLAIAQNYYHHGMKFSEPEVNWQGPSGDGKTMSEFPVLNYSAAFLFKIFGKHYGLYRGMNFLIFITGLWFLLRLLQRQFRDFWWPYIIVAAAFSAPVLVFYSINFLADVPAISIAFIGWYWFFRFYESQKAGFLWLSVFFLLFAALLKASAVLSFCAIGLVWCLETVRIITFKEGKIFNKPLLQIIPFLAAIVAIVFWYKHAEAYNNAHNGGLFLVGILPVWDLKWDKIWEISGQLFELLFYQMVGPYIFGFFTLLFFITLWNYKKANRFLLTVMLSLCFGVFAFLMLFFQVFSVHDYYLINLWVFPLFVFITFMEMALRQGWMVKPRVRFFVLFFVVVNIAYSVSLNRLKYNPKDPLAKSPLVNLHDRLFFAWAYDNDSYHYGPYETAEPYIRSLGIDRSDYVISIPDESIDITLSLIDQLGYTGFGYDYDREGDRIAFLTDTLNAKYLLINDTSFLSKPDVQPYLQKPMGQYKNLYVFDLRKK